jgi:hypothetical protein
LSLAIVTLSSREATQIVPALTAIWEEFAKNHIVTESLDDQEEDLKGAEGEDAQAKKKRKKNTPKCV